MDWSAAPRLQRASSFPICGRESLLDEVRQLRSIISQSNRSENSLNAVAARTRSEIVDAVVSNIGGECKGILAGSILTDSSKRLKTNASSSPSTSSSSCSSSSPLQLTDSQRFLVALSSSVSFNDSNHLDSLLASADSLSPSNVISKFNSIGKCQSTLAAHTLLFHFIAGKFASYWKREMWDKTLRVNGGHWNEVLAGLNTVSGKTTLFAQKLLYDTLYDLTASGMKITMNELTTLFAVDLTWKQWKERLGRKRIHHLIGSIQLAVGNYRSQRTIQSIVDGDRGGLSELNEDELADIRTTEDLVEEERSEEEKERESDKEFISNSESDSDSD
jgi:hypothetical protein